MSAPPSTAVSSPDSSLEYQSVSLVVVVGVDSACKALEITPIKAQEDHGLGILLPDARKPNILRSESRDYKMLPSPSPSQHCTEESPHPVVSNAADRLGGASGEDSREPGAEIQMRASTSTNLLFPPLPAYGPATPLRRITSLCFRITSGVLSLSFLGAIVAGSVVKSLPTFASDTLKRLKGGNPDASRPFNRIEKERAKERRVEEAYWETRQRDPPSVDGPDLETGVKGASNRQLSGGKDKLLCDIGYYARRVGLEVEEFKVETEDGFLIDLQHVFDPDDPPYYPDEGNGNVGTGTSRGKRRRKYPVLLMHGLLQNAGAFCVNDDESLAFYLCKSGYDVWLGNNRCGMKPAHANLKYSDPRMWNWNIQQMGTIDLPALIDHVLSVTAFKKLGLVCHSQGATQTFIALAKQQRPEIGSKISVFCALAPAVYAGPLLDKFYFKFMRVIPPTMFRVVFGIHAFIPFMMMMHSTVPAKIYGILGYRVFWFLFGWNDKLWDKGLRNRFFQFAPVYVSAETLRWWLGGFAKHKCILSTQTENQEVEEEEQESERERERRDNSNHETEAGEVSPSPSDSSDHVGGDAWYDDRCPPVALWIAGNDDLVDGPRLLRRFAKGREPFVNLVHAEVIEDYQHLDVIWAMDAVDRIFVELKEVVWRCVENGVKDGIVVPRGLRGGGGEASED